MAYLNSFVQCGPARTSWHTSHGRTTGAKTKSLQDSFTGKEFCDWAVDKKMMTRERAVFMGRQLVSRRFAINVDEEKLEFRVICFVFLA